MPDQRARSRIRSMRAIGFFLITLLSALSSAKKTSSILSVTVKGHYSTQRTEIRKEGSAWVCRTEITPYHYSAVRPYSESSLSKVEELSGKADNKQSCRDFVTVVSQSKKKLITSTGCADQPFFAQLLREISKNCGRN